MAAALVVFFAIFAAVYCGRDILNPPIDCQQMVAKAPSNSPWIPQCDENNQLRTLQVKQDGSKFCTNIYVASDLLDQTVGSDITCDCLTEQIERRRESVKPLYVPVCDAVTGQYMSKQCDRKGQCWCVDSNGHQLGPKWGKSVPLSLYELTPEEFDHLMADRDRQERPSCDLIAKYWNSFNARSASSS